MITRETVRTLRPVRELGDIAEFLDHKRRPIKEADRKPGPYPYFGANGQQGTIDGYLFDEPLILLAEDGGFFDTPDRGIAYRINGKSWVNNHAHVIRPKNGSTDLAYLCRVLENYDVRPFISGTTRGKLTKGQAEKILIPVPPIDEQRRIAAILDKADALRRRRKRTLELIDRAAESIFSEMFGDQVNNPRSKKRTERLGCLAEIVSGITKGRKVNGSPTRSVPYLAVANVQDKRLNLDVVKTIDATEDEIRRYRLHMNDLLLTEGGDPDKLGRGTLWRQEIDEAIHQNHIFRVRLTSTEILPIYLMWLIGSPYGKAYFLRSAKQTTGIASINKTQLSDFPVIVPPIELQMKFAASVDAVSRVAGLGLSNSRAIDALFVNLQSRAFSGQL